MDKRIESIEKDIDGVWINLKPGFIVCYDWTHGIVEGTKKEALGKMDLVVPCDCEECVRLMAAAG